MGAMSILFAALGLSSAIVPAQQDPPQVVVVAGPGEPRQLLRENLRAADFFVYDVALLMDERVQGLVRSWQQVEHNRAKTLFELLSQFQNNAAGAMDPEAIRNRSIARVARAILAKDVVPPDFTTTLVRELTDVERAEHDQLIARDRATLRFVPGTPEVDWVAARPTGAYCSLEGLFGATVYLRASLDRMPAAQRHAWDTQTNAGNSRILDRARHADALLARMFGPFESTWSPGLGGLAVVDDALVIRKTSGSPWVQLQGAIEPPPRNAATSLRAALLDVLHELATESPDDEMLQPLGLAWWRTKWLDCAQWSYVGLREIDSLSSIGGAPDAPTRPPLLVEPLPRTLRALERFDELDRAFTLTQSPEKEPHGPADRRKDLLLTVLEAQQKGEDPPTDLVDALIESLLPSPDTRPATHHPVQLDGIDGPLRRSGTYLLRVPIRWRSQPKTALVLHHFVEHAKSPGHWQPPPWGIGLRQDALPFAAGR